MAMIPFYVFAGSRAADETRSIIIPDAGGRPAAGLLRVYRVLLR